MQKSKDIKHARRANMILLFHRGLTVSEVSRQLSAARSAIRGWRNRFEQYGKAGLVPETPGQKPTTVTEDLGAYLLMLIDKELKDYAYLHSRWPSERLAERVFQDLSVAIHASTVRRLLPKLGVRWNRARPTLCIKDPTKGTKMKAITRTLNKANQ